MVLPSHQQSYLFVGSPHLGISGLRTTGHEDRSRLVSFLPCQAGSTASSPHSLAVITLERCPVPLSWQMSTVEMFPAAPLLPGTPLLWSCTVGLLPTCSLRNCLWSQYPASWIIDTQGNAKAHREVTLAHQRLLAISFRSQLLLSP